MLRLHMTLGMLDCLDDVIEVVQDLEQQDLGIELKSQEKPVQMEHQTVLQEAEVLQVEQVVVQVEQEVIMLPLLPQELQELQENFQHHQHRQLHHTNMDLEVEAEETKAFMEAIFIYTFVKPLQDRVL